MWIHIFCWGRACVYIFYEQATRRQKAKTDGWQDAAIAARIRLKMPTDEKPWVPFCRNDNFLGGPRELDCQDVAYWKMKKDVAKAGQSVDTTDWWCDYSQSSHRGAWRKDGPPSVLSSMVLYSYKHDATWSKSSHLRLLGWPKAIMGGDFKESELNSLAADGWSLPVMSAVAIACWCNPHAAWWKPDRA